MKRHKTIDAYIQDASKATQPLLKKMREAVHKAAPKAEEDIRYGLPTFRLHNKNIVHFGAYKTHIGFYPIPSGMTLLKKEAAQYKSGKATIQFPLDKPLPLSLVSKIVKFRIAEVKPKKV